MKKYYIIILIIISLAFILNSCSASGETTVESLAVITTDIATESLAADTADSTEITTAEDTVVNTAEIAPPADPNVIIEVPFPGNIVEPEFNTPFDLTAYYTEPEPVADAYNFTIITNYSYLDEYYDGNDFILPRLISDKPGAVLFNKKIIDDFLSKMNNILDKLSDKDVIQGLGASSDYCYTINGDIIIISLNTFIYLKESDGWSNRSVYYYDSGTDSELSFDEYLAEIGKTRQSILDIINEDQVRFTYSGYYYEDDFYFTADNLISAYKRDDGAFCVTVKIQNDEFLITTPYVKENNYYIYTISGNSKLKYMEIGFKQADDYSGGWRLYYQLPNYKKYELLWIDSEMVAVTYYTEPDVRSFTVIDFYPGQDNYKCNISVDDILTANNIDPKNFKIKPKLDIYPEKIDKLSKILTIKYNLIGFQLTGELYYNTETDEVYFPNNEEKPVYIKDASSLINKSENSVMFSFPYKGITVTMTLPSEIKRSTYNASDNYETILINSQYNWDTSISCYRNYTSDETTPEEGCISFFTDDNLYPGKSKTMVTENAFVSDISQTLYNGKIIDYETEFVIGYYLSGEDDVFIALKCHDLYTLDQIKDIAKSISWNKITE